MSSARKTRRGLSARGRSLTLPLRCFRSLLIHSRFAASSPPSALPAPSGGPQSAPPPSHLPSSPPFSTPPSSFSLSSSAALARPNPFVRRGSTTSCTKSLPTSSTHTTTEGPIPTSQSSPCLRQLVSRTRISTSCRRLPRRSAERRSAPTHHGCFDREDRVAPPPAPHPHHLRASLRPVLLTSS